MSTSKSSKRPWRRSSSSSTSSSKIVADNSSGISNSIWLSCSKRISRSNASKSIVSSSLREAATFVSSTGEERPWSFSSSGSTSGTGIKTSAGGTSGIPSSAVAAVTPSIGRGGGADRGSSGPGGIIPNSSSCSLKREVTASLISLEYFSKIKDSAFLMAASLSASASTMASSNKDDI